MNCKKLISIRSLLNCFLFGLKEDIQHELHILKPSNLHDEVSMAKLMEDKFSAMRSIASQPTFPWPQAHVSPPIIHRFVALPIKCLTLIEMAAWREKGPMFNYDSKFTPCHKCNPALFLCLLIEQKDSRDNTRSSEEDPPI